MSELTSLEKMRQKRILLVNFEQAEVNDLRQALQTSLDAFTFKLVLANGRDEAEQMFLIWHPDLLLIKAKDPRANYAEKNIIRLLKRIRALEQDRHVGIITIGSGGVENLENGADDFLEMPFAVDELKARIRAALRLKAIHDELRIANHRLRHLSLTDELTGLSNMRDFGQKYAKVMSSCRQGILGFGVVMLDLDYFKSVNDQTNHLFGSFVIGEVGRIFQQAKGLIEDGDFVARYGGDEFIAVLVGSQDTIVAKAEKMRILLEQHCFERQGKSIKLTGSIGVAWVPPYFQDASEEVIKLADLMLYKSKARGRNCVSTISLASPPPQQQEHRTSAATVGDGSRADALSKAMRSYLLAS